MGYMKISNLYKNQDIMMFNECYALEKIHGTSTHVRWTTENGRGIDFFSGGEKHEKFVALFNEEELNEKIKALGLDKVVIYGEGYGGKQQGMSYLYGPNLKFVAFDVKVNNSWLSVPQAEEIVLSLGLEFVHYVQIPTTLEAVNRERDADSVQAIRNKIDVSKVPEGKTLVREGVVLRPLIELTKNNDQRIISKHKSEAFDGERKTRQKIVDPAKLEVLKEAQAIAEEWVTPMRLQHVLQKLPQDVGMREVPMIIRAMVEDVTIEGEGEIVDSKEARKAIGKKAVQLFKQSLQDKLESHA